MSNINQTIRDKKVDWILNLERVVVEYTEIIYI